LTFYIYSKTRSTDYSRNKPAKVKRSSKTTARQTINHPPIDCCSSRIHTVYTMFPTNKATLYPFRTSILWPISLVNKTGVTIIRSHESHNVKSKAVMLQGSMWRPKAVKSSAPLIIIS
jgi:hypothetical protein